MLDINAVAQLIGADVVGDDQLQISGLATLADADSTQVSFLANPKYASQLESSQAGAVIVARDMADRVVSTALVVSNPYLAFAQLSHQFDWRKKVIADVHPSAIIGKSCQIHHRAQIAAGVVIGDNVRVGESCYIGPNSVIGDACTLQANTRLEANVTIYPNVSVGKNCLIHASAVIGADGFGFAKTKTGWVKICQLGTVEIGDDVEIGAATTIDRGALSATRIGNGVKLDNQVQIAHNVTLGQHTAIAGGSAIAGSTCIGDNCTIAGMSGITGHLEICDNTHITAMSLISHSIKTPGAYSSGTGVEPHARWKRNVVRFRQLDAMAKQLKNIEKEISLLSTKGKQK